MQNQPREFCMFTEQVEMKFDSFTPIFGFQAIKTAVYTPIFEYPGPVQRVL